ncbi:MAG: bifunctional 3-demethylubiquinol 3-O-methyltransferase/2-polyprenyl-6-hydroxyphenol methylase, partial [Alsobacter sp.]
GLAVTDEAGVVYNPLAGTWRLSDDMAVNYMVLAKAPAAA